jgi:hypothetical protein
MAQITPEQLQRMEAAARSVAAKLQAFQESLTPDEQRALGAALRGTGATSGETTDDVLGHTTALGGPLAPLMATLGIVTREWVDQQVRPRLSP